MKKPSPFDYVKSINSKTQVDNLTGYVPFLTNRAFAMHIDTIMFAEEMNQYHQLSPQLQFDFYFHAIRAGRRFGFPPKVEEDDNLSLVMEHFQYSRTKALEAMRLLSDNDIRRIRASHNKGGI